MGAGVGVHLHFVVAEAAFFIGQGAIDQLFELCDLERLELELLEDHLAPRSVELEVEQRVLARLAAQDGSDLLGGDGHGHGLLGRAVQHAGNQPLDAQPAVDVLAGLGAVLCGYDDVRHLELTPLAIRK